MQVLSFEELSMSVVCGNPSWKPPCIYRPNHLLQFDESSNLLLKVSQFLVPKKGMSFFYV